MSVGTHTDTFAAPQQPPKAGAPGINTREIEFGLRKMIRELAVEDPKARKRFVAELRVLKHKDKPDDKYPPSTWIGYFDLDHIADMAKAVATHTFKAQGVYLIVNPIKVACSARSFNRMKRLTKAEAEEYDTKGKPNKFRLTTNDDEILRRHIIFFDADPIRFHEDGVRMEGIACCSSDEEKAKARVVIEHLHAYLTEQGWPPCLMLVDSGSGYHLIYMIDVPVEDEGLIQRCIQGAAALFGTDQVDLDTSVFNPSRLIRVPGSMNRKGDEIPGRPHRASHIMFHPKDAAVVPIEMLEALAAHSPAPEATKATPQPAVERNRKYQETGDVSDYEMADGILMEVVAGLPSVESRVKRAMAYTAKAEPSVSHEKTSKGITASAQTLSVATSIFHGFALSERAGRPVMDAYNARCVPPWSDKELDHKISESLTTAHPKKRGHLALTDWIERNTAESQGNDPGRDPGGQSDDDDRQTDCKTFRNYELELLDPKEGEVGPDGSDAKGQWIRVPLTAKELSAALRRTMGGEPMVLASSKTLFVEGPGHKPLMLDTKDQFFAWVDERSVIVDWVNSPRFVTQNRYFEYLRMRGFQYVAIETLPHWPECPDHYYIHKPVPKPFRGENGKGALDTFIDFFTPFTEIDRQLMKACLASFFWGGGYGTRPAWFITSAPGDPKKGRGVGKSTFSALAAELSGGYLDLQAGETISDATPRILSDGAMSIRAIRLDNIKATKYSDPDLEAFITKPIISGKRLYKGEGSRPNTITVILTMNGGSLSPDLSQRIISIILARPEFRADWEREVRDYMRKHQWSIIADIGEFLSRGAEQIAPATRWAAWEAGVLSRVADPLACQEMIVARQEKADGGSAENMIIAETITREINYRYSPKRAEECCLFIRQGDMARWVSKALRDKKTTAQSNGILEQLGGDIPELTFYDKKRNGYPCYVWRGQNISKVYKPVDLVNPNEDGDSDYFGSSKAYPPGVVNCRGEANWEDLQAD